MFSQTRGQRENSRGEANEPLLGTHEDLDDDNVVFAIDDDDDYTPRDDSHQQTTALALDAEDNIGRVRFNDDVQVLGPPLRSMQASREAEFDMDSDEIDDDLPVVDEDMPRTAPTRRDRTMPLLVGLLESSSRRSMDESIPLSNGHVEVDMEELATKHTSGGSLLDSVANMANSILGAGIIGLPYAISQAGFFVGILLLVVLCFVTDWTIRLIVVNAKLSGGHSYIDIMSHCFGPSGRGAVSFFQFAFAFGGMCAFGIIIGDTIPHVIRSIFPTLETKSVLWLFTNRQFIIGLCTLCVSYPLSLYRDIHKLSRASGLALVGMFIIVFSVLIEGPHVSEDLKGDPSKRFTWLNAGIFQAIGVISFAFVCHHNSLLIYGSLKTPTLDRFAQVTHISTLLSFISCCVLAISAYVVFTDKTQGNILNNFAPNDTLINVARFCFGLNMFTTLPLELFVCREVIEQYFFPHEGFNPTRHLFFTTVILISAMFISLVTCDLGVMLEITGGVSATALAFIFPAACYYKLLDKTLPWTHRKKLPAVICVIFGAIVMSISLVLALRKTWTREGDAKICM